MNSEPRYLVVIWRETYAEVTPFEDEALAREFFATASMQWSESYLTRIIGPGRAESCTWRESVDGYWESACGESFEFTVGGPEDFSFCPYCGQEIKADPVPAEAEP